jgi:hypothetical protein
MEIKVNQTERYVTAIVSNIPSHAEVTGSLLIVYITTSRTRPRVAVAVWLNGKERKEKAHVSNMYNFTMLVGIQYFLLFHCLCRYRE